MSMNSNEWKIIIEANRFNQLLSSKCVHNYVFTKWFLITNHFQDFINEIFSNTSHVIHIYMHNVV